MIPIKSMSRRGTSPLRPLQRLSPDTTAFTGVPLCEGLRGAVVAATATPSSATTSSASGCCMAGGGTALGAATPSTGGAVPSPLEMRRTASLDALYTNKTASWSSHHHQHQHIIHDWTKASATLPHSLLIDKITQTPVEWLEDCTADVSVGWCCGPDTTNNTTGWQGVVDSTSHRYTTSTTTPFHQRRRHSNPSSPLPHLPQPLRVIGGSRCSSVGSPTVLSPTAMRPPNRRTPTDTTMRRTPDLTKRVSPSDGGGAMGSPSPSSPPPLWQPSCFPPSGHTPTALPAQGEHMDRFIRQRLQQQGTAGGGGALHSPSSARQSPVPADHSLSITLNPTTTTPTAAAVLPSVVTPRQHRMDRQHITGRSGGLAPLIPRPLLPRFRGSVEGLNQEIEGLVLRAGPWEPQALEHDDWLIDGRRAPLPDYFLRTRSVNTQTTPHSAPSSPHSLPSPHRGCSPSCYTFSPCPSTPPAGEYDAPHTPTADDDGSPCGDRSPSIRHNTSPHINKFLAREPPTGSQRVALKPSEGDRLGGSERLQELRPSVPFTLRPSLGSAFCPPQHRAAAAAASTPQPDTECLATPLPCYDDGGSSSLRREGPADDSSSNCDGSQSRKGDDGAADSARSSAAVTAQAGQ